RAAAKAQPVDGLKLSLCMIVKDEEEMLPRCLAAAKDAVDEIVIVDTGSTDRTVEIAESFGARILHHEWTGDFAAARNVSFDAAEGDWILYLDADEVMVEQDAPRLRELTRRVWREAFYLVETNFTGDLGDGTAVTHNALRVFRNRPAYRFEGRLHEQIAHRLPAYNDERIEATSIRMEHYGYLGTVRDAKEKSRRNIELLEKQAAEQSSTGPFLHFNLGSEWAAAGDADKALAAFEKSWKLLRSAEDITGYGFVPSLISRLTKAYRVTGNYAAAREHADAGLELFPGFTDLILEQAHSYHQERRYAEAAAHFERCIELGDAPSKYSATVGCGTFMALSGLAETRKAQGRLSESVAQLRRCLSDHPTFLGAVMPLAQAMLANQADPLDVVAAVEELVADMTPSVRFMLGAALYEAGHAAASEPLFRAVLDAQPDSDPAHIALAEALLSQRRWDEAVATAARVPDAGGLVHTAARAELFGAIMAHDEPAYQRALERARTTGVDRIHVIVFEAWHSLENGGPAPATLPMETTPLLATIFEALLRVEEVDPFVRILPLLDVTGLPGRERNELLALIYMRRGFLESAADEWVGACQEFGPDARALIGLAQVAYAREMHEDAALFAGEVQALEPGHTGAARLLDAIGSAV
ncbi:MAG: hypothetical protein QOJ07_1037, partial [Thermoleophilaceae bacterium]|nr:hypothetical protein [Thermoleophilaceae bacterium]